MSNSFRRSSHSGSTYIYFSHFLVHALSSLNFFQPLFPCLKLHRSWRNCKFTKQRVFLYQWVSLSAVVVEKGDKVNVSVQCSVLYYNIIIIIMIVIIIIIIIALRVWLDHINVDSDFETAILMVPICLFRWHFLGQWLHWVYGKKWN